MPLKCSSIILYGFSPFCRLTLFLTELISLESDTGKPVVFGGWSFRVFILLTGENEVREEVREEVCEEVREEDSKEVCVLGRRLFEPVRVCPGSLF